MIDATDTESLSERLNEHASERQTDTIFEIDLGGRLRFTSPEFRRTETRRNGETATPAEPIVRETNGPTEYITVHYQNGNYKWFEFNFRVRDGVAYLGSKVKLERPTNGRGWIPPEVEDAIHDHHPELEIVNRRPPWWD